MQTSSTQSKKSLIQDSLYIKGSFEKEILSKLLSNKSLDSSVLKKAVVKDIFQNQGEKKSLRTRSTYTIREGDDKRLNKNGVLRVYNINQPIDIPVKRLLGKLKKDHIGVTLFFVNGRWCTKLTENKSRRQDELLIAL